MLPVLAALFVFNFAAFVNGRLVAPAASLVFVDADTGSHTHGANHFEMTFTDAGHRFSGITTRVAECTKDKRHVHVRTITADASDSRVTGYSEEETGSHQVVLRIR
jgi:hypothetical protein